MGFLSRLFRRGKENSLAPEKNMSRDARSHPDLGNELDQIEDGLSSEDFRVRKSAVDKLKHINSNRSLDLLIRSLDDDNDSVQWSAVEALIEVGDSRAVEPLQAALERARQRVDQLQEEIDRVDDEEFAVLTNMMVEELQNSFIPLIEQAISNLDGGDQSKTDDEVGQSELDSRLLQAARGSSEESTKLVTDLVEQGANIECRNEDAETPLMRAAWAGNVDTLKTLISSGANVNVNNWEGKTPLMAAAIYGHHDAVKLLLSSEADSRATDSHGYTAEYYARSVGNDSIARLFTNAEVSSSIDSLDKSTSIAQSDKDQYLHDKQALWILVCRQCGERFKLGLDSHLVSDEDVFGFFASAGAMVVGDTSRQPDLAEHGDRTSDMMGLVPEKIRQIKEDVSKGKDRKWYCGKCQAVNEYPEGAV